MLNGVSLFRIRALRPGVVRQVLLAAMATVLLNGCDHAFEPFAENENASFSMFRYLDVEADTQWIRISPIRQNTIRDLSRSIRR